jgi:alginate O-acetyltransferase complex protein AlgI
VLLSRTCGTIEESHHPKAKRVRWTSHHPSAVVRDMVFSSPTFLFVFLPVVLLGYFFVRETKVRNLFLLGSSCLFYAWGEVAFSLVLLVSIACNYGFALLVDSMQRPQWVRLTLGLAIACNLLLLAVFKYANFIVEDVLSISFWFPDMSALALPTIHLPIGISFFTFHEISYLVDIYRKRNAAERNPVNLALYVTLFPQLIAGPIIRYHDIASQIVERSVSRRDFVTGIYIFVGGLGKKCLLADTLAITADSVFSLPAEQLTAGVAWLGILCYTYQIYYDFSGYSDMAIGLGRMFGFRFPQNFNYPYSSQSIRDFWRRWNISLSTWLRDYLYIPLGGSRRDPWRVNLNLMTVFFLCGLWHGASWNFVVWGLFHGTFILLERSRWNVILNRCHAPVRNLYVMLIVLVGWVFFRCQTLSAATGFLLAMGGFSKAAGSEFSFPLLLNAEVILILLVSATGGTGALTRVASWWLDSQAELRPQTAARLSDGIAWTRVALTMAVFWLSVASLASRTYKPFIYFQF